MHERRKSRDARRAREFESFVAGAAGRLLHAATLLTAEPPEHNPRARRLLAAALAHTYATWHSLRGEDPYDRARQQLAVRFARGAWHQYRGHTGWYQQSSSLWHALWHGRLGGHGETGAGGRAGAQGGAGGRSAAGGRPGGVLDRLTPQERLVLVLRMYEGVAEEQVAALLGLPAERVRTLCARAMSTLLRPPASARPQPKVVPS